MELKQVLKQKRNFLLLLFPVSLIVIEIAKHNSEFAEELFAKRIYHIIAQIASNITGVVPFSLAEFMVVIVPLLIVSYIIRLIYRAIKSKTQQKVILVKGFLNLLCFASVLFFMYTFGCKINYYRYTFAQYSGLTIEKSTKQELYELCESLARRANELREETLKEDEYGVFCLSMSQSQTFSEVVKAYETLSGQYPILSGNYAKGKPLLLSKLMSKMGLTGIFWPFTMEANVNVEIPDYSLPSTIAHEMAHVRGFMREDEANYLAYLACTASGNPDLQYSGVMEALVISGNALYDKDRVLYSKVAEQYSEKVDRDLNANSKYWAQFEDDTLSTVVNQVNHNYLMSNDQEDGVESYGRMVDLLLAEYRALKE